MPVCEHLYNYDVARTLDLVHNSINHVELWRSIVALSLSQAQRLLCTFLHALCSKPQLGRQISLPNYRIHGVHVDYFSQCTHSSFRPHFNSMMLTCHKLVISNKYQAWPEKVEKVNFTILQFYFDSFKIWVHQLTFIWANTSFFSKSG